MSGGYGSSGSSRGSTPSPRSSSYIQPLSIQKGRVFPNPQAPSLPRLTILPEPKQKYDPRYLDPAPNTTLTPRGYSSSSNSSSNRQSTLKPVTVDYSDRRSNDRVLDKSNDSRYYPNSYQGSSKDANKSSLSRKDLDPRYYSGSSYYR